MRGYLKYGLLGAIACILASPVLASPGTEWLESRLNADGSFQNTGDVATPFQSTAETLRTFGIVADTITVDTTASLQFINNGVLNSTENLSRKVIANAEAGNDVSGLINQLLQHQNSNGGFGDLAGYDSNPLDTAFALEALAIAGETGNPVTGFAVGYLLNSQNADGGWDLGGNETSVYLTALAMQGVWHYRNRFVGVSDAIEAGQDYLMSRQVAGGGWSTAFETALALLAILPNLPDAQPLLEAVEALEQAQSADGSWNSDVFSTALALRALELSRQPTTNPDLGRIVGRIVNAESGEALSGYDVTLAGTTAASSTTDSNGAFQFTFLPAGSYQVDFSAEGFGGFSSPVNLTPGAQVDLGTIELIPVVTATTVTVRGIVTRKSDGNPLSGVTIRANGLTAVTAANGSYQIANVPPGIISLTATRSGFVGVSASTEAAAGATVVFSPSLASSAQAPRIQGSITDASTGALLSGARITLTGANDRTIVAFSGTYSLTGLIEGLTRIEASMDGYSPVSMEVELKAAGSYDFSPALSPVGQVTTFLQGVVRDRPTGSPIAGATVSLSGVNSAMMQTDAQGRFRFEELSAGETLITVTAENYMEQSGSIVINEGDNLFMPIELLPSDYVPPAAGVAGRVLVEGTADPIAGAIVEASQADEQIVAIANTEGEFVLENVTSGKWSVLVRRTNYHAHETEFFMPSSPLELDLGDLFLAEKVRFPDLVIQSMDRSGLVSNPSDFNTSGTLIVNIVNAGHYPTSAGFEVTAYYDVDLNGVYDAAVDRQLGRRRVEQFLAADETVPVEIGIDAQLPFRDAPIWVNIDTNSEVPEILEDNNDGGTCNLAACGG